jgi:hypothetical protein
MSQPQEYSESGEPIYRYPESGKGFEFAIGDTESIALIEGHIEKFAGKPKTVYHEIISDKVHIDVHFVAPSERRPYHTLITSGMSNLPMKAPEQYKQFCYAELMLCLPPDWPLTDNDFKLLANYWPVGLLKYLARMPHQFDTWFHHSHSIPNGDPAEPYANTGFCCALLGHPRQFPPEFEQLKISAEKTIHFCSVVPIYPEEMDLKLKKGAEALWERFDKAGISELLDVRRKNVAKNLLGLF